MHNITLELPETSNHTITMAATGSFYKIRIILSASGKKKVSLNLQVTSYVIKKTVTYKLQVVGHKLQIKGYKFLVTSSNHRSQVTNFKSKDTSYKVQEKYLSLGVSICLDRDSQSRQKKS